MDGTIKLINFEGIGKMFTKIEMGDLCEKKYGFKPRIYGDAELNVSPSKQSKIIDDISHYRKILGVAEVPNKNGETNETPISQTHIAINGLNTTSSPVKKPPETIPVTDKQIEFRTKSGKKKITPIYLGPLDSVPVNPR